VDPRLRRVGRPGDGFRLLRRHPAGAALVPAAKTGLIAGIVVSGFGLAPVYIAPLSNYLLKTQGLQQSMLILGIAFGIIVCLFGMLLKTRRQATWPTRMPLRRPRKRWSKTRPPRRSCAPASSTPCGYASSSVPEPA